jgi:hypothetical protein
VKCAWRRLFTPFGECKNLVMFMFFYRLDIRGQLFISPPHKRTKGRAPVWGSEFTSKRRRTTGVVQQKPLLGCT